LDALGQYYKEAGNLDGVLTVKAEADAVFSSTSRPPMWPSESNTVEFVRLQKAYGDAIETAVAPVQSEYKDKLATLEALFTRAGNLQEAEAVKRVLDNLPVVGTWRTASGEISFVITFNADGTWSRTGYDSSGYDHSMRPHDYVGKWRWTDPGKRQIKLEWIHQGWVNDGNISTDGTKIDLSVDRYHQTILRIL
jgi:hypothetical protein